MEELFPRGVDGERHIAPVGRKVGKQVPPTSGSVASRHHTRTILFGRGAASGLEIKVEADSSDEEVDGGVNGGGKSAGKVLTLYEKGAESKSPLMTVSLEPCANCGSTDRPTRGWVYEGRRVHSTDSAMGDDVTIKFGDQHEHLEGESSTPQVDEGCSMVRSDSGYTSLIGENAVLEIPDDLSQSITDITTIARRVCRDCEIIQHRDRSLTFNPGKKQDLERKLLAMAKSQAFRTRVSSQEVMSVPSFDEVWNHGGGPCAVVGCTKVGWMNSKTMPDGSEVDIPDFTCDAHGNEYHPQGPPIWRPSTDEIWSLLVQDLVRKKPSIAGEDMTFDRTNEIASWITRRPEWKELMARKCLGTSNQGHVCWEDKPPTTQYGPLCSAFKKEQTQNPKRWKCRVDEGDGKGPCGQPSATWMSSRLFVGKSPPLCDSHESEYLEEQRCMTCRSAPRSIMTKDGERIVGIASADTGWTCEDCFPKTNMAQTVDVMRDITKNIEDPDLLSILTRPWILVMEAATKGYDENDLDDSDY